MPRSLDQVGAAVPIDGFVLIRRERPARVEKRVPENHAEADVELERKRIGVDAIVHGGQPCRDKP